MLQSIRDKAKGWVAYAIIFLISIPFALVGINQYFEGGGSRIAATVNGEEIPAQTVNTQLLELKQRMPQLSAMGNDDFLKQLALDSVINQTLLRQQVEAVGYRASEKEVAQAIREIPNFQKDGKFDNELYQNMLKAQRLNPAAFEQNIRQEITQGQLQQAIASTAFVPKVSAEAYQSLRNQEREAELFTLKAETFKDQVKPTAEEVQTYFDENKDQFMTQTRVKVAYIELDREKMAESITVDPAELETFFDANADRYKKPAERTASRILLRVEGSDDKAVKKQADDIYNKIKAGELSFSDAVKAHSQDEVSKEKDGSMGVIVAGDWDADFEKVVFETEANQVAAPVKTALGYEIVRVDSAKPAEQQTLEQVKARVERDLRQDLADKSFQDQLEEAQVLAYENNGDLAPAAEAAGLTIQESDWFTEAEGKAIAESAKVRSAAFSEDVQAGQNSEVIEVSATKSVILRSLDREEPKKKDLADVKAGIEQVLVDRGVRKLVAEKGKALLEATTKSNDWSVLESLQLGAADQVEKTGLVKRTGSKLARDVTTKLFEMNHVADGKTAWDSVVQSNGDYVVIALKSVKAGDSAVTDVATQSFGRSVSNREVSALLKALLETAEVERFPDVL